MSTRERLRHGSKILKSILSYLYREISAAVKYMVLIKLLMCCSHNLRMTLGASTYVKDFATVVLRSSVLF
jgi:hypothetical protein